MLDFHASLENKLMACSQMVGIERANTYNDTRNTQNSGSKEVEDQS